jgi:beta-lactamase regulating signal transducer with metallopeptidase domain
MQPFVEMPESVMPVVWQASWQAACVAILVWAVVTILGNRISARWRFFLWSLVFVRMALPIAPSSPTSVFRFVPTTAAQSEQAIGDDTTTSSEPTSLPAFEPREAASIAVDELTSTSAVVETSVLAPAQAESLSQIPALVTDTQTPWTWATVAAAMWLIGVALLLMRRIRQQLLLIRRARRWRPFDDAAMESLVAACCRRLGVRSRVVVVMGDDQAGPAITGAWRPRIVIPQAVLAGCSGEQLEMILLHELAHVRRRDLLWHEAFLLLRAIHWFNPVAWWAHHPLQTEREMACDEMVLDLAGGDRRQSYGMTLLRVVQGESRPMLNPGLLGTTDRSARLQRRLVMIRDYQKRTWKSACWAVAAVVMVLALGLTNPPTAQTQDSVSDDKEAKGASKPEKSLVIQGLCLDDDGKPLEGVEVWLFHFERHGVAPKENWQNKTGPTGEYRFEGLKPLDVEQQEHYLVAARKPKHTTCVRRIFAGETQGDLKLPLSSDVGALTGRVTDENGAPLAGVEVFLPLGYPLPGFLHDITDKEGRYSIADLNCWNADDTERFDPKSGTRERIAHCTFRLKHPDYPLTIGYYTAIPQEVNVQLKPGIIIEGRVLDVVTGKPATGATVAAQGLKERGFDAVVTDDNGAYRLSLTPDRYNIWAQANDRTAAALDSFEATVGEVTKAPDLKLVAGGFIAGKVVDKVTGKPMTRHPGGHAVRVANHGPARPMSGGAVEGTVVQDDGTYRLRVAPGPNYPYLMHDVDAERTPYNARSLPPIMVREGETVALDFHVAAPADGVSPPAEADDVTLKVDAGDTLTQKPGEESRQEAPAARPVRRWSLRRAEGDDSARKRPATDAGTLLNKLDELRPKAGEDEWAMVLRDLIQLGPDAVPELIAEMDATNSEYMLRCLGFVMRGIGDKRAVPALIRSLPKTCVTSRSDYGFRAKDPALLSFMRKYSHGDSSNPKNYAFGRAITEFCATLKRLTGVSHGEDEIRSVFLQGTPHQQFLQRSLYQRCAERWATWWEQSWKEHVADASFAKVNLSPLIEQSLQASTFPHGHDVTIKAHSNHTLESVRDPKSEVVFHDFDTGRKSPLPENLRTAAGQPERLDDIFAWAASEGFDLMGTEYSPPGSDKRHYVLRGLGLTVWQIGTDRWNTLEEDLQSDKTLEMGRRSGGLLARFDAAKRQYAPTETAAFLFQTREGGHGAIFVGVEVHDDGLKPGGPVSTDSELLPIAFRKGRRFAYLLITDEQQNERE